ncbi:putative permease [Pseudomonas duriflava]|uniref:Putative permease n=1 Tax=Pseudomonas duriflava TaxID=459528 RepID=A0A562Q829_9PSED|nr:AI-2E family transporter [Pseudomonas duriflava]TWI52340.1 putative permease [Pseudomonas duriflava]
MAFWRVLRHWITRYFAEDEAATLGVLLVLGCTVVVLFGSMLAPFFTALVLAFLLQGGVSRLERWHVPRLAAVLIVFLSFLGVFLALLLVVLPLVWDQLVTLLQESPRMFAQAQVLLDELQERYPKIVTPEQIQSWMGTVGNELTTLAQRALRLSLSSLGNLIGFVTFLVLVPILVFFMLKDKDVLVNFFLSLLPSKRTLMSHIWREVDDQIANYVRGKVIEIVIVAVVSYVTFYALSLPYATLLALVVGLSVLIPFIGAAAATVPVAAVAGFTFGLSESFFYVIAAYAIIQALDGNVLSPLLFSGVVNLHPVAIILAILFFGGVWGFWGIFFAIPLATLLKALWRAWPRSDPAAISNTHEGTTQEGL